jgi:putative transposase
LGRDRTRHWFLEALDSARRRLKFSLLAYVIMPEQVHVVIWPQEPIYEIRLIRTALKVPVQRKSLAFLRREAPDFLERLRHEQPNGDVHCRFWQRGGWYDRNIADSTTVRTMIEYFHLNLVRRGLVKQATDWQWSSAPSYAGRSGAILAMDPLVKFIGD